MGVVMLIIFCTRLVVKLPRVLSPPLLTMPCFTSCSAENFARPSEYCQPVLYFFTRSRMILMAGSGFFRKSTCDRCRIGTSRFRQGANCCLSPERTAIVSKYDG